MEKLTIEEFEEYKNRMQTIVQTMIEKEDDYNEEEQERFIVQYEEILKILLEHDLSDIPASSWSGMLISQTDNVFLDFSKTRANLDFSVFGEFYIQGKYGHADLTNLPNFKGCNLINFPFQKFLYLPEMFDEEFIKANPEKFLSLEIPEDVRKRFYTGEANFGDLQRYPEVREKIEVENLYFTEGEIYKLFSREEFLKLDFKFLEASKYWARRTLEGITDYSDASKVMEYLYEEAIKSMHSSIDRISSDYFSAKIDELGEEFRKRNPSFYLPEEAPESLKNSYYSRYLYLQDYIKYIDYFKDADVSIALTQPSDRDLTRYLGEDTYELFKRYGNYIDLNSMHYGTIYELPENPEYTIEEKRDVFAKIIIRGLERKPNRSLDDIEILSEIIPVEKIVDYGKYTLIIQNVGIEKLKELGFSNMESFKDGITNVEMLAKLSEFVPDMSIILPKDFRFPSNFSLEDAQRTGVEDLSVFSKDFSQDIQGAKELVDKGVPLEILSFGTQGQAIKEFIEIYGLDNLVEFDNETKIFSTPQRNGRNSQLDALAVQERNRPNYEKSEKLEVLDYQAFREEIYKLILEARGYRGGKANRGIYNSRDLPSYGHIEGKFREEHPEIFIDGVPEDIKDKFYYGILKPEDIQRYPEAIEKLKGKNLNAAFKQDINFPGLRSPDGTTIGNMVESFAEYISKTYGEEQFFKLCVDYGPLICDSTNYFTNQEFTFEEFVQELEENIYKAIQKGLNYSENVPQSFKDKYPDIFLPDSIPEDVRNLFYQGRLEFEDIRKYPELENVLKDKNIEVGFYKLTQRTWGEIERRLYASPQHKYKEFFGKINNEDILKLAAKYGKYLTTFKFEDLGEGYSSFEELEEKVKNSIREGILSGKTRYSEDAPEFFKEEHPEFFLPENAPELLKLSYYGSYTGKEEPYINHSSSNYVLKFDSIKTNPEFKQYLEGKRLDLVRDKGIANLAKQFSTQEIFEMIEIDSKGLSLLCNTDEKVEKLRRNIDERPKDRENIIRFPGYTLYFSEEKRDEFNFAEYRELVKMSKFTVSDNYRKDTAEQILSTMYDFLGYAGSKEILRLPELDEERVNEIIRSHGQAFSELYEERFKLKGNLNVLNTLFDKFVPQLPGKKSSLNVYKLLNQKLEEGYSGNLENLLYELMDENGLSIDEDKLRLVARNAIEVNTAEKIELLESTVAVSIETGFEETFANKKILKDILLNIYRKTLNAHETLDEATIRKTLEAEFSRTREDGGSFYSPHITDHLEDLMQITKEINLSQNLSSKVNKSVVDILREEKENIGQGWIRKILELRPELSKEELDKFTQKLYGQNSNATIQTLRTVRLKDTSEIGMENAYVFLKELELPGIFTYEKGEQMFAGLSKPYSENFKKFFLKNQKEILRKPEYYTKFQRMHSEFERIIEDPMVNTRFRAGAYSLKELVAELDKTTYPNVREGEYELEYVARSAGLETDYWPKAQEIYEKMQERETQTVPPVEFAGKKFRGRILRIDDPLHLVVGNITTCCQRFGEGQPGEPSMLHSALERNGSVFVVERIDEQGRVVGGPVAQSWTWRNGDRICFDNVEIPDTLESELRAENAHDEILSVYMETAKKMMDIDKKMLAKMLAEGKITQEQYDKFVVKEITMGTGCDDLIRNLSPEHKNKLTKSNTIRPIEGSKAYETVSGELKTPWIDSSVQLILVSNEEELKEENKHSTYTGEVTVDYTKIREVLRRDGRNISIDLIKRMKEMIKRAGKEESSIIGKLEGNTIAEFFEDAEDYSENEKALVLSQSSNDDWYILTREEEHSITILDSLITTGVNPIEEQKQADAKLAKYEYLNEILAIMEIAHKKGKVVNLNSEREGTYLNLETLMEKGILIRENKNLRIGDEEEVSKIRKALEVQIEKEKEARILGETLPEEKVEDQSSNSKATNDEER